MNEVEKLVEQAVKILEPSLTHPNVIGLNQYDVLRLQGATSHAVEIVTLAYAAGRKAGREEAAAIADAEAAACIEDGSPSLEDWKSASEGIAAVIRALPEG